MSDVVGSMASAGGIDSGQGGILASSATVWLRPLGFITASTQRKGAPNYRSALNYSYGAGCLLHDQLERGAAGRCIGAARSRVDRDGVGALGGSRIFV